jgi:hypothetical protein
MDFASMTGDPEVTVENRRLHSKPPSERSMSKMAIFQQLVPTPSVLHTSLRLTGFLCPSIMVKYGAAMREGTSCKWGVREGTKTTTSSVACSLIFLAISVATAQTSPAVPQHEDHGQLTLQSSLEQDLLSASSAISNVRGVAQVENSDSAPSEPTTPCQSVWIGSSDSWVRPAQLAGQMLSFPEFVNSGITISKDGEHADLAIQFVAETDGEGTRLNFLIASNAEAKVWDRISFKWPDADYLDVIAHRAVKLVLAHCAARRDNTEPESQLPTQTVKEKLSAARVMKPVVHTSFMREKILLAALGARSEFADWGIKIGGVNERSEIDLVVGHVLSTLTWTFKLVDHDSGAVLDRGTAIAFSDDRAAARIVASTVKQIAARRPLSPTHPVSATPLMTSRTVVYPGTNETWLVQARTEDMKKRFPGKMRLFIRDGSIKAADLQGRVLLSIPGNSLLDFRDSKSFSTLGDNIRLGDDALNGCDEGCAIGLFLYVPILLALDQFRVHEHEFEIAWIENKTIQVASLQVSKGDYGSLLSVLKSLSATEDHDSP